MDAAREIVLAPPKAAGRAAPAVRRSAPIWGRVGAAAQSAALALGGFALMLAIWQYIHRTHDDFPGPAATLPVLAGMLRHPFYDNGPNDKGIGIQVWMSLGRVFQGWLVGSVIAIPIGLAMGSSRVVMGLLNPLVQIMRPVSPLAWYPIGLAVLKDSPHAVIFAIVVTSLWPTLINTMFGVSSLPDDYRNIARVYQFSRWKYVQRVLVPYSLPHIFTGLRLSMGIAWVVIVAGEMLAGGTGIGYFVWDSWNALSLEKVISAILIIGTIGLLLDRAFDAVIRRVSYAA